MFGLIIFLLLAISFYVGGRRGAPLQLMYFVGYFIAFLVAGNGYRALAEKIDLYIPYLSVTQDSEMVFYSQEVSLDLDKAYYAAVAFILILFVGWLVVKFIGIFMYNLRFKRLTANKDWLIGGILSMLTTYIVIFMLLTVLAMLPLATIQNLFRESAVARAIVEHSLFLTNFFEKIWVTNILS
ncbi:CvpA family protein [Enterococcus asini]|uniref:CvpA family protein n=1 Tax=Enterococcus TaxID=1350 RepID=UPI00288E96C0|nr:CvpA family protein [Enterococcus asini]MDT2756152.1 CvpA family protein [Enterococcus asini]